MKFCILELTFFYLSPKATWICGKQSEAFFVVGGKRNLALGLPIQSAQTEEGRDEFAVMTLSTSKYVH